MKITQEGHTDHLEYGWWEAKRGHLLLPKTLGDKHNFVLSPEELAHYDLMLTQFAEVVQTEREHVAYTMRCFRSGRTPTWEQRTPICFTLAHIMEFMIKFAKAKLELMHILLYIARNRNAQGSSAQADQGPVSFDH